MSEKATKGSSKKSAVKKKAPVKKAVAVKKSSPKKSSPKKSSPKKSSPKKRAGVKKSTASNTSSKKRTKITAAQRRQMIAEAAYYIAEQRNFLGGDVHNDWLEAEKQIDLQYEAVNQLPST